MPNTEGNVKKVGVGFIASWILCIYFIFLGINVMRFGGFPEGLFFLLAGILAIPVLGNFVKKMGIEISLLLRVVLIILCIGIGYFIQWNKVAAEQYLLRPIEQPKPVAIR